MGIPRSPYSPPWNLQKPGRNLPNQPQRFHLPSAHETETHITIRALSIKRASINLVMAKCLFARGAYVGVLSSWSLNECEEIDTVFAAEIRRRLRTSKHPNQRICSNLFVKAVWVINVSPRWFNSESEIACVASSRGVTNGPAWQSKDYAPVATAALTTPLSLQSPHNVSARVSGSLAFCPTV